MRITGIHIKHYRSIEDSTDLSITKLFALIGKNNSGKSAFIDAIRVFWQEKDLVENDFHKGAHSSISIKITLEDLKGYPENNGKVEILYEATKDKLKGEYKINGKKSAAKDIKTLLPKLLTIPAIRNPENETTAGAKSFLKELTSNILKIDSDEQHDLEKLKASQAKDLTLEQINVLLKTKAKERLTDISKIASTHFQDAMTDDSMSLEVDPEGNLSKAISLCTNVLDPHFGKELKSINVLTCGTGLQSMVILALLQTYAEVENKDDSIMLIEEPEVYLHPELQRKMFDALRGIAKDTQVIFTTHSPIMISELWTNESIKLVKRIDGKSSFEAIDIQGVISELGIKYEDVLNPKVTVFVEGDEDIVLFREMVKKLFPQYASNIDRRIKFISTDGYRNIHLFALMKILHSENVISKFFLVADSDGYKVETRKTSLKQQIVQQVPEADKGDVLADKIYVLSEYEIHTYLLDYELLKHIIPSISQTEFDSFKDKYFQKYREARERYLKSESSTDRNLLSKFKPSSLFDHLRKEEQKRFLYELYGKDDEFMKVRDAIADNWRGLKLKKTSPIRMMIEKAELGKVETLAEIQRVLTEILAKTDDSPTVPTAALQR